MKRPALFIVLALGLWRVSGVPVALELGKGGASGHLATGGVLVQVALLLGAVLYDALVHRNPLVVQTQSSPSALKRCSLRLDERPEPPKRQAAPSRA